MLRAPFYDPEKTYEENCEKGPFNGFADDMVTEPGKPRFNFLGQKVAYLFGIPAGPLVAGRFVQAALDKGFDIVTYKTVRTRTYPCHPWPNVLSVNIDGDLTLEKAQENVVANHDYHEPLSITNSFGVPSLDPSVWQEDLSRVVHALKPGQVVIGSFQGTKDATGKTDAFITDFRHAARLVKEAGAPILEVNMSCPNEGTSHLLCFDTKRSAEVAHAIKNEIGDTPLIVKIAYFEDDDALREFVKEVGPIADGIAAINTIPAAIVDSSGKQAMPGEGRLRSGVCGKSIAWAGLAMVKQLAALRTELGLHFALIGVGGVTTPEDFRAYRDAGADVVMSATGAMWNPLLAQEIKAAYPDG